MIVTVELNTHPFGTFKIELSEALTLVRGCPPAQDPRIRAQVINNQFLPIIFVSYEDAKKFAEAILMLTGKTE